MTSRHPSIRFTISLAAMAGISAMAAIAAAAQTAGAAATASSDGSDHYFRMKQVQIMDQTQQPSKPAYELMIPTTWQFKGWVNVNATEGGCFADWFAVVGDAKSADNSIELQILPQFTWQYVTDPQAQRQLQQENQQGAKFGIKPSLQPVRPQP